MNGEVPRLGTFGALMRFAAQLEREAAERYATWAREPGRGGGFAALADIWINGYSFATAIIGEFAPAAGPNILNSMILTPILLAAYEAVQARTGR